MRPTALWHGRVLRAEGLTTWWTRRGCCVRFSSRAHRVARCRVWRTDGGPVASPDRTTFADKQRTQVSAGDAGRLACCVLDARRRLRCPLTALTPSAPEHAIVECGARIVLTQRGVDAFCGMGWTLTGCSSDAVGSWSRLSWSAWSEQRRRHGRRSGCSLGSLPSSASSCSALSPRSWGRSDGPLRQWLRQWGWDRQARSA